MDDRTIQIIGQSLLKSTWIGSGDSGHEVDEKIKHMLDLVLHKIPAWAHESPLVMSKQRETKIKKAMESAIADNDHGAIWEIWSELDKPEQDQLYSTMDRWREQDWSKAIEAARGTMLATKDPRYI